MPAPTLLTLSDGLVRTVEGTVEEVNDESDVHAPTTGSVRLTVRWPAGAPSRPFVCGERIRAAVRLLPTESYHDPGAWSREEYLLDEGVTSSTTVSAASVERLGASPGRYLSCRLTGLQHATTARLLALPAAMRRMPAPLLAFTLHPYASAARYLRLTAIDIKLPPRLAAFRVALRMVAARLANIASGFLGWRAFPWTLRSIIRVMELMGIALVVELAMALPMAVDFHRITLYAMPVNLLTLPLLAVLMPAALLTLLALLVWPAVALVPAGFTALVLHLGVGLVHPFGSMRLGDLRISDPLPVQQATFWILLAAAIALAAQSRPEEVDALRYMGSAVCGSLCCRCSAAGGASSWCAAG